MKQLQTSPNSPLIDRVEQSRIFQDRTKLSLCSNVGNSRELDGKLWPTFGDFLVLCAFLLFAFSVAMTVMVFHWLDDFPVLASLAVYFVISNAVLLTGAVVVAILSTESYDMD